MVPLSTPFRRLALAAPIYLLLDWWVLVECGTCRSTTHYPLRLLAGQYGGGLSLGAALHRLRCKRCRVPAALIQLTDDPTSGSIGALPPTWRLQLRPELAE